MSSITLKITTAPAVRPTAAARRPGLRRILAYHWDLFAVLGLLGSSAACAVYTLAHLA